MRPGALASLLLLPLLTAGLQVAFPCQSTVCFHTWRISRSHHAILLRNGRIPQTRQEEPCSADVAYPSDSDVGRHRCAQPEALPEQSAVTEDPVLVSAPQTPVSLQCILLSYLQQGACPSDVQLWWEDESGEEIPSDSEHDQESSCNATVTVTLPGLGTRTFRCRAREGQEVEASVKLRVQVPGRKGRRGQTILRDREGERGSSRLGLSLALGAAGGVALAAIAALLVHRRRARQPPGTAPIKFNVIPEACDSEEVIYADVVLPAARGQTTVLDSDATEYACIRYR